MLNSNSNGGVAEDDARTVDPVTIHGPRPGVTRISRRSVLLAAVFGASLGLVVLVTGFGDRRGTTGKSGADENAIRPTGPIESVRDLPADYSFDVRQAAQGIGYAGLTASGAPATRPSGLSPQDQALVEQLRQLAEMRRKLLEEQKKEQDQAMDSPLVFAGAKPLAATLGAAPGRPPTTVPTFVMVGPTGMPMGNGITDGGGDSGSGGAGGLGSLSSNRQSAKEAFLTQSSAIEPYLSKPLLAPVSKFELKAGSIIPGALVTAINTDLPGDVIGQVSENVYDSVTGNYLLIPQGSRLLGKYQSLVTNGQNRALLVWQRLIYPNGNSIVLDGMPGTDEIGQAGLADKVDYHLDKIAEATALTTAIAYGGNLARGHQNSSGYGNQDVIGDTVAQQANRIGDRILDRQLDLQPTITIRSGWPLRVLVNKDMILEPYSQ
jgi:type IV secretory pathway VirB10-like protein